MDNQKTNNITSPSQGGINSPSGAGGITSPSGAGGMDVTIVGGGLAGLSLSIQLAKAGYKVALFEKEKYPFHKVCGEYISMESWDFIEQLGLPLRNLNLPVIKNLIVSSPSGKIISSKLDMGGFGISRYFLDNELYKMALQNGVKIFEETKVTDVFYKNDIFTISAPSFNMQSKLVAGTFGKRSNLDIRWARKFVKQKPNKLNNYIGVKYHIQSDFLPGTIALHNFKNGYCGISKIEGNTHCLCYLTTATNLKANNNSIAVMEKNILHKNPHLKDIFSSAKFIYDSPLTISQISFGKKKQVENHVIMIGDSAGMITPLCGNGMSMAFNAGKLAFESIDKYLKNHISRKQMEEEYIYQWNKHFAKRLRAGRIIQKFFAKNRLTNMFIGVLRHCPWLIRLLVKSTHGKPF